MVSIMWHWRLQSWRFRTDWGQKCLREGYFPDIWKIQKQVLLLKPDKPTGDSTESAITITTGVPQGSFTRANDVDYNIRWNVETWIFQRRRDRWFHGWRRRPKDDTHKEVEGLTAETFSIIETWISGVKLNITADTREGQIAIHVV